MLTALRVSLVTFVAIVVQSAVFAKVDIGGARPDVVMLVAIAAGMEAGPERGAIVGFGSGLAFDLLLDTRLGMSALTYCIVGYVVGSFQTSVIRATWWIPVVTAMLASALGVLLFALFARVMGDVTVDPGRLPVIVAVVAVTNGLLSRPFRWAMRWALAEPSPRRDRLPLR